MQTVVNGHDVKLHPPTPNEMILQSTSYPLQFNPIHFSTPNHIYPLLFTSTSYLRHPSPQLAQIYRSGLMWSRAHLSTLSTSCPFQSTLILSISVVPLNPLFIHNNPFESTTYPLQYTFNRFIKHQSTSIYCIHFMAP